MPETYAASARTRSLPTPILCEDNLLSLVHPSNRSPSTSTISSSGPSCSLILPESATSVISNVTSASVSAEPSTTSSSATTTHAPPSSPVSPPPPPSAALPPTHPHPHQAALFKQSSLPIPASPHASALRLPLPPGSRETALPRGQVFLARPTTPTPRNVSAPSLHCLALESPGLVGGGGIYLEADDEDAENAHRTDSWDMGRLEDRPAPVCPARASTPAPGIWKKTLSRNCVFDVLDDAGVGILRNDDAVADAERPAMLLDDAANVENMFNSYEMYDEAGSELSTSLLGSVNAHSVTSASQQRHQRRSSKGGRLLSSLKQLQFRMVRRERTTLDEYSGVYQNYGFEQDGMMPFSPPTLRQRLRLSTPNPNPSAVNAGRRDLWGKESWRDGERADDGGARHYSIQADEYVGFMIQDATVKQAEGRKKRGWWKRIFRRSR